MRAAARSFVESVKVRYRQLWGGVGRWLLGSVTLHLGADATVEAREGMLYFRAGSLSAGPVSCRGLKVEIGGVRANDQSGAIIPSARYVRVSASAGWATLYVSQGVDVQKQAQILPFRHNPKRERQRTADPGGHEAECQLRPAIHDPVRRETALALACASALRMVKLRRSM